MEAGLAALAGAFAASFSPEAAPRKQAEEFLRTAGTQAGYGLSVLQLASTAGVEEHIRQAAAVAFKNHIKYHWSPALSTDSINAAQSLTIPDGEKEQIKSLFVGLMLVMPPKIQAQLSEALTIISSTDFPDKWQSLLPELLSKLQTGDYSITNGVLMTADSIFRRYRGQFRTVELVRELQYVFELFVKPMLELLKATSALLASTTDNERLKLLLTAVLHIGNIFYSLNNIDLPEVFEDTMGEWMAEFHKYLAYENAALAEPDKPSIVDQVKAVICENINLYLRIAEEEFAPHLNGFATAIWHLLLQVGQEPQKDELATQGIRCLTSIVNSVHSAIFQDPDTLRRICESIVIPNLQFRASDEEIFSDNWVEYIRRDVEGSDTDTRRRVACELVKGLTNKFKETVTAAISGYVTALLAEYAADPQRKWRQKDCAIYLIMALTVRGKSDAKGVVATNELVSIGDFFTGHIIPELQAPVKAGSDVLKADSLKFLTTFRSQIPKATVLALLPSVAALLASECNVVHSYAALCIERCLTLREGTGSSPLRFDAAALMPVRDVLLANLFGAMTLPDSAENDYVMKAIMRTLSVLDKDVGALAPTCMERLAAMLTEQARNPKNPAFAHYLFESVAALVRGCGADLAQLRAFEGLLFPPFQFILQTDVAEFAPYVFQLLALLLETRPSGQPLPPAYLLLFPPLLSPVLWERPANVPALVRLLQAYLQKAPGELVAGGHLLAVLGVFQRLISSRAHDHEGFYVLNTLVENLPPPAWLAQLPQVWGLLLTRLQHSGTVKFKRAFSVFMSLMLAKHGPGLVQESLDKVQAGLLTQLVESIWLLNIASLGGTTERKLVVVAGAKLLTEWPPLALVAEPAPPLWGRVLEAVLGQFEQHDDDGGGQGDGEEDGGEGEEQQGYTAAYARLRNAAKPESDPLAEVGDAKLYLARALAAAAAAAPGRLAPRAALLPPPTQGALAAVFHGAGVQPA